MKYPNPCCRCGFCCLSETCPIGQGFYSVGKYDLCPGLSFKGDKAICALIKSAPDLGKAYLGKDTGCCIKARAFKDGVQYDFASLPVKLKRAVARNLKNRKEALKGDKDDSL